jgi:hypothetical protein
MEVGNTAFLGNWRLTMENYRTNGQSAPIPLRQGLLYTAAAVVSFYFAYSSRFLSVLVVAYLFCLLQLARLSTPRQAFYTGLAAGFIAGVTQLLCFWTIFGPGAIVLWLVLAFWIGLFVALVRLCRIRLPLWTPFLVPVLWTGLEFFRSELYYLRFSWLNIGYAFAGNLPAPLFRWLGMYGIGFVAAALAAVLLILRAVAARWLALGIVCAFAVGLLLPHFGAG